VAHIVPAQLKVPPSALGTAIQDALISGLVPMVWGPPGCGKTQIIEAVAHNIGRTFLTFRPANTDPLDGAGIGVPDHGSRRLVRYPGPFIPRDPNTLWFIDEITSANPDQQASLWGWVFERMVAEHRLPEDLWIVCAGNQHGDNSVVYDMRWPLRSRMVHIYVEPTPLDWYHWGLGSGMHPVVLTWAKSLGEFSDDANRQTGGVTPRTLEMASRIMHAATPSRDLLLYGALGVAGATGLLNHESVATGVPPVEEILADPLGAPVFDRDSAKRLYVIALMVRTVLAKAKQKVDPANPASPTVKTAAWRYLVRLGDAMAVMAIQEAVAALKAKQSVGDPATKNWTLDDVWYTPDTAALMLKDGVRGVMGFALGGGA
jgi:hypothetical protein